VMTKRENYDIMLCMKEITTKSPEETMNFAIDFTKRLKGGEILALEGDLGSGKTTFTKGLAEELRVSDTITSPTFVLLKPYEAKIADKKIEFVHVDAYRVESIEDIKSVGIEDYLDRDDVVLVIEWADKIKGILPKDTIELKFTTMDENERKIKYDFNN